MQSNDKKLRELINQGKLELWDAIFFFLAVNKINPNIKSQTQYKQIIKNNQDQLANFRAYQDTYNLMHGYDKITQYMNKNDQAWLFVALKGILYIKLINSFKYFYNSIKPEHRLALASKGIDIRSEMSSIKTKLIEIIHTSQIIPFANLNKENSAVKTPKHFYDFYEVMIYMIETSDSINKFLIPEIQEFHDNLQTTQYLTNEYQRTKQKKREREASTSSNINNDNYLSPPKKSKQQQNHIENIDLRLSAISVSDLTRNSLEVERDSFSEFIGGSNITDFDSNPLRPSAQEFMLSLQETESNNKNSQNIQSVYNCSQTYMEAREQSNQTQLIDIPKEMAESMTTAIV